MCVCAPRWCENVHLGCSVHASEGEGDGPQASESLCVSGCVPERVGMWRRCPGEGVHRVGDRRVPEARSSQQGGGAVGLRGLGAPGDCPTHTPRLGPRCPDSLAPAPSHSHPLSHKDFSRWSLLARRSVAGNCSKRCRWRGLRRTPRAGSRQGRAAAPARGEARPRGPRAARQAARAAPSRPAFLTGLIPPPGGGPDQGRHPARLLRAPPPGCGDPQSPRLQVSSPCRVRPPLPPCKGPRPRPPEPLGPSRASSTGQPR